MKDGKTYWYKLDKQGGLWWSTSGTKWSAVKGGAWADSDGKWLKIHDKKLMWSADGKTWSEVPEWKWKGSDGKWYKFDADWTNADKIVRDFHTSFACNASRHLPTDAEMNSGCPVAPGR